MDKSNPQFSDFNYIINKCYKLLYLKQFNDDFRIVLLKLL